MNDNTTRTYRALAGETLACVLFEATQQVLGLPEEKCADEIYSAMSTMIRSGLLACNRFDPDGSIIYGAATVITPMRLVLQ